MIVVTVARRPTESATVASNVLLHGCGALDIDGSRVAGTGVSNHARSAESSVSKGIYGDSRGQETHQTEGQKLGRWPANLILQHLEGCVCVGSRSVQGHKGYPDGPKGKSHHYSSDARGEEVRPNAWAAPATNEDGTETVANWQCAPDCPVAALDEQSGDLHARGNTTVKDHGSDYAASSYHFGGRETAFAGDKGGASRFFKQCKAGGQTP